MPTPQPAPRSLVSTLADVFPNVGKHGETLRSQYAVLLFVGPPPPARTICRLPAQNRFIHLN